jgi:hypothetical protein
MRLTAGTLLVACLGAAAGCSKGGQVDNLYVSVSTELCRYLFNCCESSELGAFRQAFTDQTGCERHVNVLLQAEHDAYRLAVARGGVDIVGEAMEACLSALRVLTCGSVKLSSSAKAPPFSSTTLSPLEACTPAKLYVGNRQAGQACETLLDCAPGTTCYASSLLKSSGVCTPLRQRGEPCSSSKDCLTGLVCNHPLNTFSTCQVPAQEGESCREVSCDPEQKELYCDSSQDPRNPVCTRRVRAAEGQPCAGVSSVQCQSGLYCDYYTTPTSPVCARLRKGGEPCMSGSQCESGRCESFSKTCIAVLCDGRANGPPPQLDIGMPDQRPDWKPWIPDGRQDWKPAPDWRPWPDFYPWPDQRRPDF